MKQPSYCYLVTNKKEGTLYVGVSTDIRKRIYQHQHGLIDGFSKKYKLKKLVWFEEHTSIESAILREKQIKEWKRQWKINLINRFNPEWKDLSIDIYK